MQLSLVTILSHLIDKKQRKSMIVYFTVFLWDAVKHDSFIHSFIIWLHNQVLVKTCLRKSFHFTVSRAQFFQSRATRALLSLFTPSDHLNFGLSWFRLPSGTSYHVCSVAQSIALHDTDDIWAVELSIECTSSYFLGWW
jgi:hypothetical protein